MKKKDLYTFLKGLKATKFVHPRCTYAVNKNKRQVEEVIADMEKAVEPDEEMKKFTTEREELAKKHSAQDDKGNPQLKKLPGDAPGEFQMIYDIIGQTDPKSNYNKALAKVEKKFEKAIKEHEEKIRKYNEEFLEDDTEYKVFMLDGGILDQHEECPQEVMDLIHWMVDYEK